MARAPSHASASARADGKQTSPSPRRSCLRAMAAAERSLRCFPRTSRFPTASRCDWDAARAQQGGHASPQRHAARRACMHPCSQMGTRGHALVLWPGRKTLQAHAGCARCVKAHLHGAPKVHFKGPPACTGSGWGSGWGWQGLHPALYPAAVLGARPGPRTSLWHMHVKSGELGRGALGM